ncbi:11894_t:CDS:10, partial [Acaulospora colombiana]
MLKLRHPSITEETGTPSNSSRRSHIIDSLIEESYRISKYPQDALRWIPFENFGKIECFAQGEFAEIALAFHQKNERHPTTDCEKEIPDHIALRFIKKSRVIDEKLINEIRTHHKCMVHSRNVIPLYGLTQDPRTLDHALVLKHARHDLNAIEGVLPYIAPEILLGSKYSPKTDIYSFSMIMWELVSGQSPYYEYQVHDIRLALDIIKGVRPRIPDGTPEDFRDLINACWSGNPADRPDSVQLLMIFENMLRMCDDCENENFYFEGVTRKMKEGGLEGEDYNANQEDSIPKCDALDDEDPTIQIDDINMNNHRESIHEKNISIVNRSYKQAVDGTRDPATEGNSIFMLKSVTSPKIAEIVKSDVNSIDNGLISYQVDAPVDDEKKTNPQRHVADVKGYVPEDVSMNATDSQEASSLSDGTDMSQSDSCSEVDSEEQKMPQEPISVQVPQSFDLPLKSEAPSLSHGNTIDMSQANSVSDSDFEVQKVPQEPTSVPLSHASDLLSKSELPITDNHDSISDEESDAGDPMLDKMVSIMNSLITEATVSVETPVRGREKNSFKQFDLNKLGDFDFSDINDALDENQELFEYSMSEFNRSMTELTNFFDEITMTDDTVNENMHDDDRQCLDLEDRFLQDQDESLEDLDDFTNQCRFLTRVLILPFLKFTHTFMSESLRREEFGTIRSIIYVIYWTFLFTLGALAMDSWLCEVSGRQVIRLLIRLGQISFDNRCSYGGVVSKAKPHFNPSLLEECEKTMRRRSEHNPSNLFYGQVDSEGQKIINSENRRIDALIENFNSPADTFKWIPFQLFRDMEFLAQGGFAKIVLASYSDPNEKFTRERVIPEKIVLKLVKNSCEISKRLIDEIRVHHECMLHSSNIIPFYGLTQDPKTLDYALVIKHATHGDLRGFLGNHLITQTWKEKLNILLGLARALRSIHQLNLVHRDFHCKNILVDGDTYSVFVCDFGLCTTVENLIDGSNVIEGVLPYMAPEVLRGNKYTFKSDIYSFSMIMWEVVSSKPPYYEYDEHNINLALDIIKGARPKISVDVPKEIQNLIEACWNGQPLYRPDSAQLVSTLEVLTSICENWDATKMTGANVVMSLVTRDLANVITEIPKEEKSSYVTKQFDLSVDDICEEENDECRVEESYEECYNEEKSKKSDEFSQEMADVDESDTESLSTKDNESKRYSSISPSSPIIPASSAISPSPVMPVLPSSVIPLTPVILVPPPPSVIYSESSVIPSTPIIPMLPPHIKVPVESPPLPSPSSSQSLPGPVNKSKKRYRKKLDFDVDQLDDASEVEKRPSGD